MQMQVQGQVCLRVRLLWCASVVSSRAVQGKVSCSLRGGRPEYNTCTIRVCGPITVHLRSVSVVKACVTSSICPENHTNIAYTPLHSTAALSFMRENKTDFRTFCDVPNTLRQMVWGFCTMYGHTSTLDEEQWETGLR
uniref:Secreted protein n=1 Tax=Rhipicephalus appendiculatus TaxID=34631 RepID=A0A131YCX5_RHIAP